MGNCMEKPPQHDHQVNSESDKSCLMNVYVSDPRLPVVVTRSVLVQGDISAGPRSDDVVTLGMPSEYQPSEAGGNFLYDVVADPDAADAVHCVAVVGRVVQMYRRALERIGSSMVLRWQWGSAPLGVRPHAGERPSACYSRDRGELHFSYTKTPKTNKVLFLCRSYDIVAHMAGHAVLDGLKPTFGKDGSSEEVKAMHESFADLTAIFSFISQLETCEQMIQWCDGDLRSLSDYIPEIDGEELRDMFGGQEFGLRSVRFGVKITDVVSEHHNWSCAFTSAVYEILVRMCMESPTRTGRPEKLHLSGVHLCSLVLRAYLEVPLFDATFRDLAKVMQQAEPDPKVQAIIKEEFKRRKFFDKNEKPKRWHGVNQIGGCTTMAEKGTLIWTIYIVLKYSPLWNMSSTTVQNRLVWKNC